MAQTKIKLVADGVIDSNHLAAGHTITTDNIGEGTNLYYTDARVGSYLSTNSYATEGYVTTAVANLVDAAPSTLDTLNELAAALGDDPNFATTVTNSIATKLPLAGGTLTGDLIVNTNVGIGTSSPDLGAISGTRVLTIASPEIERWGILELAGNRTWGGNQVGEIKFISTDATNNGVLVSLTAINDPTSTGTGGSLKFLTRPDGGTLTERMRIDSSGNVGIGTISPTNKLDVAGSINVPDTHFFRYNADTGLIGSGTCIVGGTSTQLGIRAANDILFAAGGTSERMRITSGGGVGIGVSDPRGDLSFKNQIPNGVFAPTSYSASNTSPGQNFISNYYTSASYGLYNYPRYMDIVAVGQPDGSNGGSHIRFFTNPRTASAPAVQRMEIAYDGTVLINGGQLHLRSSTRIIEGTPDDKLRIWQRNANSIDFLTYDQTRMRIDANGNIGAPTGTNIYNASDQRLKRNVRPIENGLSIVNSLNPVKFNWIAGFNEYEENKELLGFIAQEVQQALPEAVEQFAEGKVEVGDEVIESTLRVNEKFIIPVLTKAIQELNAKVQELENKLTANGIN